LTVSGTQTENACKREISVEVPADVVARETQNTLERFQKRARLPGFRRGRVPASILKQRFGDDIKSEVIESLVPRYFRREAEKQGLNPVSQPRVTDLEMREGEPLRFKASFEVLPEIAVSGYQELRAEKPEISVSDEEVEKALQDLRERHATFTALEDRPLAEGDYAQASLRGTPKDKDNANAEAAKPVEMDELLIQSGGPETLPEFTENRRGVSPGEERSFDVTYPADFSDERLAGKTIIYSVAVKAVKQKKLPGLNDDFAKEVGDFQTLEDLKKRLRESLEGEKRHRAQHQAKEKLVDELLRRNEFPVPESLVEKQVDVRLERGLRALAAQGMRTEDMKKMDFQRLRAGQREAALRELKTSLLLDRIADAEKIEVGDEEIENEIKALAEQTKQPAESVRARLTRDGALDRIRNRIRNEKTLEFLYQRSA